MSLEIINHRNECLGVEGSDRRLQGRQFPTYPLLKVKDGECQGCRIAVSRG